MLRPSIATVALLLTFFTALAVVPADYALPLGFALQIDVADGNRPIPALADLINFAGSVAPDNQMSVSISQSGDQATALFLVFGTDTRAEELENRLREEYPAFAHARFTTTEIIGRFDGSLLGRIGRQFLSIDITNRTADQVRRTVLTELSGQGRSDAGVDSRSENGRHWIEVKLGAER